MVSINHEEELKKAELKKIHAEIARLESDRDKIELEKGEIVARNSQKWWNIRASGLIQAVIGGSVAGVLVAGFALDHFLKISELHEKTQNALQIDKKGLVDKAKKLKTKANLLESKQEENRQVIIALRDENNKLKTETEETLKRLSELAASESQNKEAPLNSEIALLKTELDRTKVKIESRERSLDKKLINLSQEQILQGNNDNWFSVVASPYNEADLRGKLKELSQSPLNYPVHVYRTADKRGSPVYAITFEGYLSKSQAYERVRYARKEGIAKDAYPWSSNIWGVNIVDKFANN